MCCMWYFGVLARIAGRRRHDPYTLRGFMYLRSFEILGFVCYDDIGYSLFDIVLMIKNMV